jgi:hypothetical protein
MKKTLATLAIISLVIGSYYYGRHEGYVAGVLDTTADYIISNQFPCYSERFFHQPLSQSSRVSLGQL